MHSVVTEIGMHGVFAVVTHQWWLSVSECHKPCSLPRITPRLARIHDHHFIETFSTGHLLVPRQVLAFDPMPRYSVVPAENVELLSFCITRQQGLLLHKVDV